MYIGIDIGGTKCAVLLADQDGRILHKHRFPTADKDKTLANILETVIRLKNEADQNIKSVGISCGGPLDSKRGLILSPPNLPGWDRVPITDLVCSAVGANAYLCNDANACALAEWRFGAGVGSNNMIFLTFGTGLGAGLILNGRLYEGSNGNAGECGHIRLSDHGPVGYGKIGSFEGFCSGGGLAQIGRSLALVAIQQGSPAEWCKEAGNLVDIDAKILQDYADRGDPIATEAYRICGEKLGLGLSILMDLFDPDCIVLGSIYARAEHLLREHALRVMQRETLFQSLNHCRILPAKLGEEIGDYAAIAIAMQGGK